MLVLLLLLFCLHRYVGITFFFFILPNILDNLQPTNIVSLCTLNTIRYDIVIIIYQVPTSREDDVYKQALLTALHLYCVKPQHLGAVC